ncbi:tyrosine-type recombinase/integrase [Flavobacterium sp. SM15]|uniref:tyrosine-type recombinase/integrase n=1 Tax=Flavobacterium sp. SM15 TaxID=2908005 RepID=UPI001EDBCC1E|nr:tyrosine-type recombinase/integrase [Flavobacterium sp. SM15]MCG2610595.1 tyrosine-type recombinase/integrase [Flavobacterium sp. SM15]
MLTNQQAYRDYLQKEKNYSLHTVAAYLKDLSEFEQFLKHRDDDAALEQVAYGQIRSWVVELVEKGILNTSINRKISSLKSFYKFLLKTKQIELNPLQKHKSLKTPKKVQIPFSEKELEMVFDENDYPDDFEGIRNRLIIELFYTTGMRRAELISLEISNFSPYAKTLKVLGKRNKERILPLLDCTVALLNSYLEVRKTFVGSSSGNLLILNKNGHKVSETFVYRLINNYFSNVSEKVKKSPHVLRHTFATHLLNNGADLNSVKELLGHASLSSTQIYTHSSLSELKRVYQDAHPRSQK